MILSILIATITSRKEQFNTLYQFLVKQIQENNLQNDVEILYMEDDKEYPVGLKRNILIESAKGDFTCFIDDDDWISDDYVSLIVSSIKDHPDIDCLGIKGLLMSKDLGNKEFVHSIQYDRYFEDSKMYYRPPNHLSPMRREIADRYKFPNINFGEDYAWAMKILKSGDIKKEFFIDKIIYHYYFEFAKSETAYSRGEIVLNEIP